MRSVSATDAPPDLLDTADAARFLHVHPKTLMRWVRAGAVAAMRTPGGRLRFRRADLEDFVSAGIQPREGT